MGTDISLATSSAMRSHGSLSRDVFDYIGIFNNPKRKPARNGMLSSTEFERRQMMRPEGV